MGERKSGDFVLKMIFCLCFVLLFVTNKALERPHIFITCFLTSFDPAWILGDFHGEIGKKQLPECKSAPYLECMLTLRLVRIRLRKGGWVAFLLGMLVCSSCTPSRYVRPLAEKQWAVSGTFGGPIFRNFGASIPIPYTSLAAAYGLKEKLTLWGGFHLTSASFGVIQTDFGALYAIRKPEAWKPGISLAPVLNLAGDVWEGNFKLWPQIDANAYWEYGERKHFFYAGISSWFELAGTKANNVEQGAQIFPGFQIGNTCAFKKWEYTLEAKWNGVNLANEGVTLDYISPGGQGALGINFAFTRKF